MRTITLDQSLIYLDEILTEFGEDYEYEGISVEHSRVCYYSKSDNPDKPNCGCIIGELLRKFGVDVVKLDADIARRYGTESLNVSAIPEFLAEQEFKYESERLIRFLTDVQDHQDSCYTWGNAVAKAKELMLV